MPVSVSTASARFVAAKLAWKRRIECIMAKKDAIHQTSLDHFCAVYSIKATTSKENNISHLFEGLHAPSLVKKVGCIGLHKVNDII